MYSVKAIIQYRLYSVYIANNLNKYLKQNTENSVRRFSSTF